MSLTIHRILSWLRVNIGEDDDSVLCEKYSHVVVPVPLLFDPVQIHWGRLKNAIQVLLPLGVWSVRYLPILLHASHVGRNGNPNVLSLNYILAVLIPRRIQENLYCYLQYSRHSGCIFHLAETGKCWCYHPLQYPNLYELVSLYLSQNQQYVVRIRLAPTLLYNMPLGFLTQNY